MELGLAGRGLERMSDSDTISSEFVALQTALAGRCDARVTNLMVRG